jgi:hypothetical protein
VSGVIPYDSFKTVLDEQLGSAKSAAADELINKIFKE